VLKPEIAEIGKTAGEIWEYLGQNGPMRVAELPERIKRKSVLIHQALGWLAREGKIDLNIKSQSICLVSLTDPELHHYQRKLKEAVVADKK
jgi:hypothetical protein